MNILTKLFQRKYKPTDNIKRFGDIMQGIQDYKIDVETSLRCSPVEFKQYFELAIHTPAKIGANLAILEFDLSMERSVTKSLGREAPNTSHYGDLLNFAESKLKRISHNAYGIHHKDVEAVA